MRKILIIEDEPDLLEELCRILRYEQIEVIKTATCKEGAELINTKNPDLILCDLLFGSRLEGFWMLKEIRSNPETASIPFIFISALCEQKFIRKGMDMGANEYLIKPFSLRSLLNVINKYFDITAEIQK
jgi:DNA-binding response OmpR family regulator